MKKLYAEECWQTTCCKFLHFFSRHCCMHAIDRKMKKITQFHRMRMNTWRLLSAIKRHQKMAWSSCIKLYLCYQLQQYTHFGENITKVVYDSNPPLGRNRQKLHYSWNRVAIPITIPRRLGFLCHFKYGKIELKFFFCGDRRSLICKLYQYLYHLHA